MNSNSFILKVFFLILFILNSVHCLYGQDSLKQLLKTTVPDSTRIDLLGELSLKYTGIDLDSTIYFAEEAVALARSVKDKERLGYMLKNVGIGYYYKGDFVNTLGFWEESLLTFKEIGNLKGESNLLGNIGAVYNSTGDYPKSIDYHLRCLRIAEKNKDDFRMATALQNIGAVYSNMEDFEGSEKYYNQAMVLCEKIGYEKCIGIVSMNLSEVYRDQGDFEKAASSIEESKVIFEKLNDPSLPEAMIASAHLASENGNFEEAVIESNAAYELAKENDSKVFMQRAKVVLGIAYNGLGKYSLARDALNEATTMGEEVGPNLDLQQAYEGLKEAYVGLELPVKVVEVQEELISLNKQIYDNEKNNTIANLELSFDLENKESEIALLNADIERANLQRNFFLASAGLLFLLAIGGIARFRFIRRTNKIITEERNKADQLLLNILPEETAKELKTNGTVIPKKYGHTTVLFTDFVGFSKEASDLEPEDLVRSIDFYFKHFDKIIEKHNLEKIKTIGDSYMCVGGLPMENTTNTIDALTAAWEILEFVKDTSDNPPKGITPFQIRIGLNSGPLVAGVVGTRKFQYDIWGDTVNVASRMESNSEPNQINVSENVFSAVKDQVRFKHRGEIEVKNMGVMKMYYLDELHAN